MRPVFACFGSQHHRIPGREPIHQAHIELRTDSLLLVCRVYVQPQHELARIVRPPHMPDVAPSDNEVVAFGDDLKSEQAEIPILVTIAIPGQPAVKAGVYGSSYGRL